MNQVTSFLRWWSAIPAVLFLSLFVFTGISYAGDDDNNEVKVCYAPSNVLDPYEEKEFDTDAEATAWLAGYSGGHKGECSDTEKGDEVCRIPSDDNEPAETIKVRHGKTADWITVYSADTVGECADDLKEEKICHFPNGTSQPAENRKIRKNAWTSWSAEHSDDQKRECTDDELTGTSWESVSSSTTVDANCVALTTVVTSETELITYEKEMKKSAESKRKDYEDKRKDEESLVISDPDNADEHQANKDKYDDLEKEYKKSKDEHEDREKEHETKKKRFLDDDDDEDSAATTATQVPSGSSACTTPDGTAGFLPPTPSDAANGSASSPTKKALREIFGQ